MFLFFPFQSLVDLSASKDFQMYFNLLHKIKVCQQRQQWVIVQKEKKSYVLPLLSLRYSSFQL